MVAGVNPFHVHFAVVDFVSQGVLQYYLDFYVFDGASLHDEEIISLVNLALVNDFSQFPPEYAVQPDMRASSVSFPERMRNVHLHIFFNNLVKC